MLEIKKKPHQKVIHHGSKLRPLLHALRRVVTGVLVIGLILTAIGFAYTWYNSKYGEEPKVTATLKPKPKPRERVKPSPTGPVNASVQSLTTPIMPGSNASITVHTNADANCTITVEYNKVASKDSGLIPKKADDMGLVTWGWTVPANTPVGKWPVKVTCANLKKSGMVIGDLVVTNEAPKPLE